MTWRGNEFYDNIRYGLDPHDDSNGFLVQNNRFHDNGSHGLIFSKRCLYNVIDDNLSYNNRLHGVMLHQMSNFNIIENNVLKDNNDGVALWHSSYNLVTNNKISGNKSGIRANVDSNDNVISSNSIKDTKEYGIYFYTGADHNTVTDNTILNSKNAMYIRTSDNYLANNHLEDNTVGFHFIGDIANNIVKDNIVKYTKSIAILIKNPGEAQNFRDNNTLYRNHNNFEVRKK